MYTKIDETEGILKEVLENNEYEETQKTIKPNEALMKKNLHQQKSKKFNNFWYKPKAQIKATTTEETENTEALTYAEKFFQETEHNNQLTKQ